MAIGRTSGDPQGRWALQSPLQIHIQETYCLGLTRKDRTEKVVVSWLNWALLFKLRSFSEVGKFTKDFFFGKERLLSFCRADTLRLASGLELKLEFVGFFCKYVNLCRFGQRKKFAR